MSRPLSPWHMVASVIAAYALAAFAGWVVAARLFRRYFVEGASL